MIVYSDVVTKTNHGVNIMVYRIKLDDGRWIRVSQDIFESWTGEKQNTNYQLYTRILRLVDLLDPCLGADGSDLNQIVRDVIYPDTGLVWC